MSIFKWLQNRFASPEVNPPSIPSESHSNAVWGVVANIVLEHTSPGTGEAYRGTKHFTAGSKVYILEFRWPERVKLLGRHRKSKRFIEIMMSADHLRNWRAEPIYHPHARKVVGASAQFSKFPTGSPESRRHAEEIAARCQEQRSIQPFITRQAGDAPEPIT